MLTEEQIKATIVQRIIVAQGSCNPTHLNCIDAQLRALVYVLGNGNPPPSGMSYVGACKAAGIPVSEHDGNEFDIPDDWMAEHGFVEDQHPTLGVGW